MKNCKCTLVYKASDGKEFDTLEECQAWEQRPRVYVVMHFQEDVATNTIRSESHIESNKSYVDYELAQNECLKLQRAAKLMRAPYRRYKYWVETIEVDTTTQKSLQERITNTEPKPPKTWFGKIWEEFWRYKGDDK